MRTHVGNMVQEDIVVYAADGAVDPATTSLAVLDSSSATVAATLADGDEGQLIEFKCIDASNAVTVTPANFQDGTNATFTANDALTLRFAAGAWHVIGNYGTVIA